MQDFNHDLQPVSSFSKYSWRWAHVVSFTRLYSELCLALYHFTVLLLRVSGITDSERKSGMLAQPQWMGSPPTPWRWGWGKEDYWTREGQFSRRNSRVGPGNLRFFSKSAGVSFNSVRNKFKLLSDYRNICSRHVNLIILTLLLNYKVQGFQRREAMLMSLINTPLL